MRYALPILLLLSGCGGGTAPVTMMNPKTGATAQCLDDSRFSGSAAHVLNCADAYEDKGWMRVPGSK
jgi:PBP1b-binding outer membrane lipoprotein LpoB